MLQLFQFADSREGFALCLMYKLVDSLDHALVVLLPLYLVFPRIISEAQPHFTNFRSAPLPSFSCAMAVRRRLALAGVRKR